MRLLGKQLLSESAPSRAISLTTWLRSCVQLTMWNILWQIDTTFGVKKNTCFVNAFRLEFDAYKADYEALKVASSRDSAAVARYDEATRKFEQHRAKFEKLRADVGVKLQFLEENKVQICLRKSARQYPYHTRILCVGSAISSRRYRASLRISKMKIRN